MTASVAYSARSVFKQAYFQLRRAGGADARSRRAQAGSLVILTAHQFRLSGRDGIAEAQPIDAFGRHLRFLTRHYRFVSLEDGLAELQAGRAPQDDARPLACLTVDDGFADGYEVLYPQLRALGLTATFFLPTDFLDHGAPPWPIELADILEAAQVDRIPAPVALPLGTTAERHRAKAALKALWSGLSPHARRQELDALARTLQAKDRRLRRPMAWDNVREMHADGQGFGSHTTFHSILPPMSDAVLGSELVEPKLRLEDELQAPCKLFAYPNGDWDDRTAQAVRGAGYAAAVTQDGGVNAPGADLFSLKRINLPPDDRLPSFVCRIAEPGPQ